MIYNTKNRNDTTEGQKKNKKNLMQEESWLSNI